MVLTPQLLQAIKLLQMPNAELAAFVEEELERNPMLERAEDQRQRGQARAERANAAAPEADARRLGERRPRRPTRTRSRKSLGTEIENAFDPDRAATPAERTPADEGLGSSASSWTGVSGRSGRRSGLRHRGLCRRRRNR